ncbi:ATP-binding cassette domain-containing protein [Aestuariibacter sp. A3R04]|uniref:ATP-binding cassette domain-containing protein n=1 Tax=Aestuariibacter sp. A3R04 TaxID=2841571 RepID=UPI001C0955AB|nr:ATP-binding cassette domain-containing protein [Aestuariibacter sp. A3R04]MBU3021525.1 ATP-binding cassette domain-containing protein [Aestuariibacter sp. A3R04]
MIEINQCTVAFNPDFSFYVDACHIELGKHVVVVGANGSGKSALIAALAGEGECQLGERRIEGTVGWVSTAQQLALIAEEKKKDDADILDVVPVPSSAREVIFRNYPSLTMQQEARFRTLTEGLRMSHFLNNSFLGLSTGETRKVLLVKTLLETPDVLILDEPWDGLDAESAAFLCAYLERIHHSCTQVLAINRLSEIPQYMCRFIVMKQGSIAGQSYGDALTDDDKNHLRHLLHLESVPKALPLKDLDRFAPNMAAGEPVLIRLRDGKVNYDGRTIFSGLTWQINKGEHWQVVGPNGSGKTCLLSMITGDDPHCYTNDLMVFGFQRGSGESIWDIKQHIGLVSNSFHLQYRVNCSALHVVLSGFFDSIGLYEQPTVKQKQLAREWLALAGMNDRINTPFQSLSFGDQRLLLIVRAMVKHPALLILDEPCNGLDEINRLKVLALLGIIANGGESTLLYVNHHREDRIAGVNRVLDMTQYNPAK